MKNTELDKIAIAEGRAAAKEMLDRPEFKNLDKDLVFRSLPVMQTIMTPEYFDHLGRDAAAVTLGLRILLAAAESYQARKIKWMD